jgi:hypothetical protein
MFTVTYLMFILATQNADAYLIQPTVDATAVTSVSKTALSWNLTGEKVQITSSDNPFNFHGHGVLI